MARSVTELAGAAFTLFYSVMGIPCAWLADRGSRRNLMLRDPKQIGVAIALLCAVVVPLGALAIALA